MKRYYVNWGLGSFPRANVTLTASSDEEASNMADKIAREVNCINTPRQLSRDGECIEILNKGTK